MARFCTGCGAPLEDDKKFCTSCGAPAPTGEPAASAPQPPPPPAAQAATAVMDPPKASPTAVPAASVGGDTAPAKGSRYEPITMGGYIGIMLLMCIPLVGQILTIVWACGGCRKINKRNLARAMLVFLIISIVLGVVFYFVGQALWGNILQESGLGDLLGQAGGLGGILEQLPAR